MPLGKYYLKDQATLARNWNQLVDNKANGVLSIITVNKEINIDNPSIRNKTFTERTFYGMMGHKVEYKEDGTVYSGSVENKKIKFVIPLERVPGYDFRGFQNLLEQADTNIKVNNDEVILSDITFDNLANCIVINFDKIQGQSNESQT